MFFNNLKWQLLASSIIAVILVACFIAFAANGYITISIVLATLIAVYIIAVNIWFDVFVSKPIQSLADTVKRITSGSYGSQAIKTADNEIGKLTDEVNVMSRKIASSDIATTEFISQISHELRTPLAAITGWTEVLEYEETLSAESKRGIGIIKTEADRLSRLVADLLIFTRVQDNRFHLRLELSDIAEQFEDAMFTYGTIMKQAGIDFHYSVPDYDIPLIPLDAERLKQVLFNLLDNATKHGEDGKLVEAALTADDSRIVITIRDHGKGIPEAELPFVKNKFYKGSSKRRGSGIGLAVCDEIVQKHGGTLCIGNAEGGGCIATIIFPKAKS